MNNHQVEGKVSACYSEEPFPNLFARSKDPEADCRSMGDWFEANFSILHLSDITPPKTILVAGCGTGEEAIVLSRRFPDSQITAIDITDASLAIAAQNMTRMNVPNVTLRKISIIDGLSALPSRYDLVFCSGVLHHLSDPSQGFKNLAALLAPEGHLLVTLYHSWGLAGYRFERFLLKILAGDDPTQRIKWTQRLHFKYHCGRTGLFDGYVHPQVSSFSISEVFNWGVICSLVLTRISPPLEPRRLLGFAEKNVRYVYSRKPLVQFLLAILRRISQDPQAGAPFKYNRLKILLGEIIFAVVRKGECWYLFKK
jgi:SAM-dependent methyltransferase